MSGVSKPRASKIKVSKRELDGLADHNRAGHCDLAPNSRQRSAAGVGGTWKCRRCTLENERDDHCGACREPRDAPTRRAAAEATRLIGDRKRERAREDEPDEIQSVDWGHHGGTGDLVSQDRPLKYNRSIRWSDESMTPLDVGTTLKIFCLELASELRERTPTGGRVKKKSQLKLFRPWCVDHNTGYRRAHLEKGVLEGCELGENCDLVPAGFSVKGVARPGIVFLNDEENTCVTHFDRDTSILLLVQGEKTVLLAPPHHGLPQSKRSADGADISNSAHFHNVRPFDELDATGTPPPGWTIMKLTEGQALLLPKFWLHAIRSSKNTLALSLQVEVARNGNKRSKRHKLLPQVS